MSEIDDIRQKRLDHLQDKERKYAGNLILEPDTIVKILSAFKQSPPTVTDAQHPDHWWNTTFGKLIKQEWEMKIDQIISHVKRMKMPL